MASVRLSASLATVSAVRILHLADVHLDRPFIGLPLDAARRRRGELRATFERCLELAVERAVDLVTIGGDLWEEEHVTTDTRSWVAAKLEALNLPVAVGCGNHDPLIPGGSHARAAWPANVHRFVSCEPTELAFDLASVWGASWTGGGFSTEFLDRFRAPRDGRTHLLLLHGTAGASAYLDEEGRHGPFDAEAVTRAGFARCLAGHIHAAHEVGPVVYPGSPEPLGWSETDRHCVALIDIAADGCVDVELVDVNAREYVHRTVVVDGANSSADVERSLAVALDDPDPARLFLRVTLTGEIDAGCAVQPEALAARHRDYAALVVVDATRSAFDFAALAEQPTALGRFVKDLRERVAHAESEEERSTLELALLAGARAMHGEGEVLRVD
jgi:DNA repair protein SbcD/Mre11